MENQTFNAEKNFFPKMQSEINSMEASVKPMLNDCLKYRIECQKMLVEFSTLCSPMLVEYQRSLENMESKVSTERTKLLTAYNQLEALGIEMKKE